MKYVRVIRLPRPPSTTGCLYNALSGHYMDVSSAEDKEVEKDLIEKIRSELQEEVALAKCRRCGCMKEALENLHFSLSLLKGRGSSDLLLNVEGWLQQMEPIKYACLGCEYCFPAVVMNIFALWLNC
jgi:hypothetical protein